MLRCHRARSWNVSMEFDELVFDAARAGHLIDPRVVDEHCIVCGELAAHIVSEPVRRPNSGYVGVLCCTHFSWILGDCGIFKQGPPRQRWSGELFRR